MRDRLALLHRNTSTWGTPEDVPALVSRDDAEATLCAARPGALIGWRGDPGARFPLFSDGAGAPVLGVHGLGHDASDFGALFERAPVDVHMLAMDLPGFGAADKPQGDELQRLVDATLLVARECERPPVVVGSSLGGHVAMLAALEDPDAIAGLSLLSPGGMTPMPSAMRDGARAFYSEATICSRTDDEVVANARRIFADASPAREALAAKKLALHRSPLRAELARPFAAVVDDVVARQIPERLIELRGVPTQVVLGDKDVIVPRPPVIAGAAAMGAQLHVLEGVGHLPMIERADHVAELIFSFAARVFAAASTQEAPRVHG